MAKTIDWPGSLLRGKMAIVPMLIELVGPKLVSGIQVGPLGLVVRKLVVFQMPPCAAPMKTVLPDGSEGSTASAVTSPAPEKVPVLLPSPAGPTAVQVFCDWAFVGSI